VIDRPLSWQSDKVTGSILLQAVALSCDRLEGQRSQSLAGLDLKPLPRLKDTHPDLYATLSELGTTTTTNDLPRGGDGGGVVGSLLSLTTGASCLCRVAERKRQEVILEIINTERSYIRFSLSLFSLSLY
jgi:hypothetical protein